MDIKKLLGVAVLASTVSVGSATAGEMGDTGLYLGLSGVGSAVSDFDFNNNRAARCARRISIRLSAACCGSVTTSAQSALRWKEALVL